MSYPIVGIGGKLGAGKDAVADYLVKRYGWTKQGMSDTLLSYTLILNPWIQTDEGFIRAADLVESVGYTEAKTYPEFREFLQKLGTEVGRDINEDTWVNLAERRAVTASQSTPVIVTGIRFENELDMIRRQPQGVLVYVQREGMRVQRGRLDSTTKHESESSVGISDFDLVLGNKGTLEDLYQRVDGDLLRFIVMA